MKRLICLLCSGALLVQNALAAIGTQVQEEWHLSFTPSGAVGPEVTALKADAAGNLFLLGHGYFTQSTEDIVLARFDTRGARIWEQRLGTLDRDEFASSFDIRGGRIAIAGSSKDSAGSWRIFVAQHGTDGTLGWSRLIETSETRGGSSLAVAMDAYGSVVVGGTSVSANGSDDFIVLKYSVAGELLWRFRYDGPGEKADSLSDLKLDSRGNIYGVGTSADIGGRVMLATVKLSPEGQLLWVDRFAPSDPLLNVTAHSVAVDGLDHAVVLGNIGGELVTVKYSHDGQRTWQSAYRSGERYAVVGKQVLVDSSDNVLALAHLYGAGINDTVLLKWSSEGRQLWESRIAAFDEVYHAAGMALDSRGDAYLTGTAYYNLTAKVAAGGSQDWQVELGRAGLFDRARTVTADDTGNVFVGGQAYGVGSQSIFLVKYRQNPVVNKPRVSVVPDFASVEPGSQVVFNAQASGEGNLHYQWRHRGRPIFGATSSSLTLTNVQDADRGTYSVEVSNNFGSTLSPEFGLVILSRPTISVGPTQLTAFVGAQAEFGVSFLERDPLNPYWYGTEPFRYQWSHNGDPIVDGTNATLRLTNLKLSDAGHYELSVSNPAGSVTSNIGSLLVSSAVEQVSVRRSPGREPFAPGQPLMRLGTNGSLVVASPLRGNGTRLLTALTKYGSNDEVLWLSSLEIEVPRTLVLDAEGNSYLSGFSQGSNLLWVTIKCDPKGQVLWRAQFERAISAGSLGTGLALDPSGDVTVAGRDGATTLVIRYDSHGVERWVTRDLPSASPSYNQAQSVVVDELGNSYLGTTVVHDSTHSDLVLLKLDPSGKQVWQRSFIGGAYAAFTDLALDGTGNILILGNSLTDQFQVATVVVKYSPDGKALWSRLLVGEDREEVRIEFHSRALLPDPKGDVCVVFSVEDDDDTFLGAGAVKLDASGEIKWQREEMGLILTSPTQPFLDPAGNLYLTGVGRDLHNGPNLKTLKYGHDGTRLWGVDYGLPGNGYEFACAVVVAPDETAYVLGEGGSLRGELPDTLLLRYRQSGPPNPLALGLVRWSNGSLHFLRPPGTNTFLEVSGDLIHWVPLADDEVKELEQLRNPDHPVQPRRFFRATAPTELRTE